MEATKKRTARTCLWPIGDPATSEFHFCGAPRVSGRPYCVEHGLLAHQKDTNRRPLKPSPFAAGRSTPRSR
jgi:GcrA cell cycle regulator